MDKLKTHSEENDPFWPALAAYASYTERCGEEMRRKMIRLKIPGADHQKYMDRLVEGNYINDLRFAKLFAGGKFRQKAWGRVKIIARLKELHIPADYIQQAMLEIDAEDYMESAQKTAQKKWETLHKEPAEARKIKTIRYLLQKGFDYDHASKALRRIMAAGKPE